MLAGNSTAHDMHTIVFGFRTAALGIALGQGSVVDAPNDSWDGTGDISRDDTMYGTCNDTRVVVESYPGLACNASLARKTGQAVIRVPSRGLTPLRKPAFEYHSGLALQSS